MKLTGIGNGNCNVCIFLVSDKEAYCNQLETKSVVLYEKTMEDYYRPYSLDGTNLRSGLIEFYNHCNQVVSSGPFVITKMLGTIPDNLAKDDLGFSFLNPTFKWETYYTKEAAFSKAMNSAIWIPCIPLMLWVFFSFRTTKRNLLFLLSAALLGGLFLWYEYSSLPISEVEIRRAPIFDTDELE